MSKLTRLYRLESLSGKGLYQRDELNGTSMWVDETMDTDLWLCGRRRKVPYVTRGGSKCVQRNGLVDIYSFDSIMPSPCKKQLPLELPEPGRRLTLSELILSEDYGTATERADCGFANDAIEVVYEQLPLDVTLPRCVVDRKIRRGEAFTLSDAIGHSLHGENEDRYARSNDSRPMPTSDNLKLSWEEIHDKYWFAFKSIQDMRNWFDGLGPEVCMKLGASIRVMDVRNVLIGNKQAMFRPRDVVKEFRITDTERFNLMGRPKAGRFNKHC